MKILLFSDRQDSYFGAGGWSFRVQRSLHGPELQPHCSARPKASQAKDKKNLCNQMIALIFATESLHIKQFVKMRRDVFQGIADPTRRAILSLIMFQSMTPNALAEHFNCSRQAVSKHIKILTECQLVKQEHSGREIYCYLNTKKMKEVDKWLAPFRAQWEARFDQLDNLLKNIKTKKS